MRTVHKGTSRDCAVFLNKDLLFARGGEGFAIWEVKSGHVRKTFEHRGKGVGRFAVSSQKNWIAGATMDELIDAFTGQTVTKLHEISNQGDFRVGQFEFSRDEKLVAATFGTNTVDLWDTASGSLLRRFKSQPMSTSVAFSPDGELLASGSAWFSSVAKNIKYENEPIAKAVPETCFLQVWETKTGRQVFYKEEPYAGGIWDLTFSPDGRQLAVAMGMYHEVRTTSGHIKLWDVSTWRIVHDLRGHTGSVWSVAFNESGTRLASGSGNWLSKTFGQTKVWDVTTGLELLTLATDLDSVFGVAFSPDSRRLATANSKGLIRIWDGSPFLSSIPIFEALSGR